MRVLERSPQPLARVEAYQETVGVVHLGAEVVERRVEPSPKKNMLVRGARPSVFGARRANRRRLHVDTGRRPRGHDEAIGSRHARAVEQREQLHARGVGGGFDEPELDEVGELLAARLDGVDGESAGRQAVDVVAAEGAEVARAQEDDDLVVVLRPLQRIVDADSGVPDVGRDAIREGVLAVVEEAGGEGQRALPGRRRRRGSARCDRSTGRDGRAGPGTPSRPRAREPDRGGTGCRAIGRRSSPPRASTAALPSADCDRAREPSARPSAPRWTGRRRRRSAPRRAPRW